MTKEHTGLVWLADMNQEKVKEEDFAAKQAGKYTVKGINPHDPNWLKKAAAKVKPAKGDDYVLLDHGLLTVNQINWMLRSVFGEMTYCDDAHQLMWYNRNLDPHYKMLAQRKPEQVGDTMDAVHPHLGNVIKYAKQVWYGLRTKFKGHDELWVPVSKGRDKPISHYERYKRIEDEDGNFRGIFEWVFDLKPLVDYYLKTNGLKAVPDEKKESPDWVPSPADKALKKRLTRKNDADSSASH